MEPQRARFLLQIEVDPARRHGAELQDNGHLDHAGAGYSDYAGPVVDVVNEARFEADWDASTDHGAQCIADLYKLQEEFCSFLRGGAIRCAP
jgi:hypothetical protein